MIFVLTSTGTVDSKGGGNPGPTHDDDKHDRGGGGQQAGRSQRDISRSHTTGSGPSLVRIKVHTKARFGREVTEAKLIIQPPLLPNSEQGGTQIRMHTAPARTSPSSRFLFILYLEREGDLIHVVDQTQMAVDGSYLL